MKKKPSKKPGPHTRRFAGSPARSLLHEILAPTDFSATSRAGVRYAVALAKKLRAKVELLHVIEPPSRLAGMEAVVIAREDSELTALARGQLERLAERAREGDLHLTSCVRSGKPFHEIASSARERAVDLIVIATHGYTGAKRALLGSTAERVTRHASCPVLAVPARTTPNRFGSTSPLKLEKVLVPIDFSRTSKTALPWATFLAAHFEADIVLLNVVEKFPIDYLLGREQRNKRIVPLMTQAETELERMAGRLRNSTGLNLSALVRAGNPFEEICQSAKALGADLIVLTTHGYTGLKHVWLGSTAERVVRHAPCPVLAVRELSRMPF